MVFIPVSVGELDSLKGSKSFVLIHKASGGKLSGFLNLIGRSKGELEFSILEHIQRLNISSCNDLLVTIKFKKVSL